MRLTVPKLRRMVRTAITLVGLISLTCSPNLSNPYGSLEDLIQAALDALERQD